MLLHFSYFGPTIHIQGRVKTMDHPIVLSWGGADKESSKASLLSLPGGPKKSWTRGGVAFLNAWAGIFSVEHNALPASFLSEQRAVLDTSPLPTPTGPIGREAPSGQHAGAGGTRSYHRRDRSQRRARGPHRRTHEKNSYSGAVREVGLGWPWGDRWRCIQFLI